MEPDDYGEPEIDRLLRELGLELPDVEDDADDLPPPNDNNLEDWEWR